MAYTGYATNNIGPANWWDNSLAQLPSSAEPLSAPGLSSMSVFNNGPFVTQEPTWWTSFSNGLADSGFLGKTLANGDKVQGWGGPLLGAIGSLGNAWMGAQNLKVAKDTLDQQKKAFQMNFDAQRKTTNAQLSDRQAARVASNPGAYQSVGDYMKQYGV